MNRSPAKARRPRARHRSALRWLGWLLPLVLILGAWTSSRSASAEDRVTIRGNYYRERSTRVLQPMVEVTADAPDERLTVGAGYLLDAISSASIAAGAQAVTGGDMVFTEFRHEATGSLSSRLGSWQLGGHFLYSTETDYQSRALTTSVGRDFLAKSLNFTLVYGYQWDRIFQIIDSTGRRAGWCGGASGRFCQSGGRGLGSNLLQTHRFALQYTQAYRKTLLGGFSLEYGNVRGPQDNPYRGGQIPTANEENHPLVRNWVALTSDLRWIIPKGRTVLQPQYRFYVDDWSIKAHSVDLRVHVRMLRHLRMRLRYRFYTQSESFFWRDDNQYSNLEERCTLDDLDACASADPKMDDFLSHTPGIQLTYELDGLARFRGLRWLEHGWIQATYNHVFQTNRYGNARLAAAEFSLAF